MIDVYQKGKNHAWFDRKNSNARLISLDQIWIPGRNQMPLEENERVDKDDIDSDSIYFEIKVI